MTERQPTHPGEILKEDLMPALKLNATKMAGYLLISRQYMSDILNGKKALTPLLCLKVGKLAGNGPELWMNMQAKYDLWFAEHNEKNQAILSNIPSVEEIKDAHL